MFIWTENGELKEVELGKVRISVDISNTPDYTVYRGPGFNTTIKANDKWADTLCVKSK